MATVMSVPVGPLNMIDCTPPMLSLRSPMPWPTGDQVLPPDGREKRPALVAA
jgi:hypothetical protein